jgi:hypothetical protein
LNFRGAITWGEFVISDNLLVGPAIDEVAELHQRADAAIVELTTLAAGHLLRFRSFEPVPIELRADHLALEHDVPLKEGGSDRRWVVNPFAICSTPSEMHEVLDGMKRAFGEDAPERHPTKYRNTLALASAARAAKELVLGAAGRGER